MISSLTPPTDDIIDMLLDQEGFECDPVNRSDADTPLHSAVRYINALAPSPAAVEEGNALVTMMLDAGSDPRIRNRAKLTPAQLADPANPSLRRVLQDAIDIAQNAGDFAADEEEEEEVPEEYEGSDDDIDPEEFKREVERRKKAAAQAANGDAGMI